MRHRSTTTPEERRAMNRANPTPSPRRALATAALIAALVGLAALLAQCRNSNDVLGVGLQRGADQASACTRNCQTTYKNAIKDENNLHAANERACGTDQTCLANEEARHDAALASIKRAYDNCINNCHSQGRGTAGN